MNNRPSPASLLIGFIAPLLIAVPAAVVGLRSSGYIPGWLPGLLIVLAIVATAPERRALLARVTS